MAVVAVVAVVVAAAMVAAVATAVAAMAGMHRQYHHRIEEFFVLIQNLLSERHPECKVRARSVVGLLSGIAYVVEQEKCVAHAGGRVDGRRERRRAGSARATKTRPCTLQDPQCGESLSTYLTFFLLSAVILSPPGLARSMASILPRFCER